MSETKIQSLSVNTENGGKITINDEGTEYVFKKTKNMFEGIVKNKSNEVNSENKNEEKENKKEDNAQMQMLENKIMTQEKGQNEENEAKYNEEL